MISYDICKSCNIIQNSQQNLIKSCATLRINWDQHCPLELDQQVCWSPGDARGGNKRPCKSLWLIEGPCLLCGSFKIIEKWWNYESISLFLDTTQFVKACLTWYSCHYFVTVTGYIVNEESRASVRTICPKLQCSRIPRRCDRRWYVRSTERSEIMCVGRISIIHSDAIVMTSCMGFCFETSECEQNNLKYAANEAWSITHLS